jgi:putative transposase
VRRIVRKRRAIAVTANACLVRQAEEMNDVWTWDFAFDRTRSGSALKWLSIVGEFSRECLALKVVRGMTSEDVIDTLAELSAMRGVPNAIRRGNGPEFVAKAIQNWLAKVGVQTLYIKPGSPWENGYA